ncbi:MAG: acyl carrier protein [bacterium]
MGLDVNEVTNEVREIAADFVGIDPEELDLNKKLRIEYGISSIEASEIIMEMEDRYKIKIPVEEAIKILSCQDAIDYLMKHVQ